VSTSGHLNPVKEENKMTVTTIKNPDQAKQHRILNTLKNLMMLPKVSVTSEENKEGICRIWLTHPQEYFPTFEMQWCPGKKHYRVYIHVAAIGYEKTNAGYSIFSIPNGFAAAAFVTFYGFIHKHRANSKSEAVA
jgi:hypothetical protein